MEYWARRLLAKNSGGYQKSDVPLRVSIIIASFAFALNHFFYLIYYIALGAYWTIPVNVFGLLLYGAIIAVNRQNRSFAAGVAMVFWLAAFCVIMTYLIGWEIGTAYYLPIILIPIYTLKQVPKAILHCTIVFFALAILVCFYLKVYVPPYYQGLDLNLVTFVNIVIYLLGGGWGTLVLSMSNHYMEKHYMGEIENLTGEAHRDALTNMWNRRHMEQVLEEMFADRARKNTSYLAIVDIDHFKAVNDTYGHSAGDAVLRVVAEMIISSFRSSDIPSRWGGDEFVVLLTAADQPGAFRALDNLRRKVEDIEINIGGLYIHITLTIGFSKCAGIRDYSDCINKIDSALYFGKEHGRNRTILYSDKTKQKEAK